MYMNNFEIGTDLIVFSSNTFNSIETRTAQMLARFSIRWRVYFFEAPIMGATNESTYFIKKNKMGVNIVQPYLPGDLSAFDQTQAMLKIINELLSDEHVDVYTFMTDTPKSMPLIRELDPEVVVYDCPKHYGNSHHELEQELFQYADVVLNQGYDKHSHALNMHDTFRKDVFSLAQKAYVRFSLG